MLTYRTESIAPKTSENTRTFARCIENSKRISWDIDRDVIRGRTFDFSQTFLPDGLSLIPSLKFLTEEQQVRLSQIQGRTYALVFGLVERFINAKILEITTDYWLEDQAALEALVRFSDEELKHQELFRRIEALIAAEMPAGYRFNVDANDLARAVLSKSSWAVMALTLHIELFTQLHYQVSIAGDDRLSPLFKDVFLYHWKEESQHAIMDEIEWRKIDARISDDQRRQGVSDFLELVQALDGILREQATNDAQYFRSIYASNLSEGQTATVREQLLEAYRWQYIHSGARHRHFVKVLQELVADKDLLDSIFSAIDNLS